MQRQFVQSDALAWIQKHKRSSKRAMQCNQWCTVIARSYNIFINSIPICGISLWKQSNMHKKIDAAKHVQPKSSNNRSRNTERKTAERAKGSTVSAGNTKRNF